MQLALLLPSVMARTYTCKSGVVGHGRRPRSRPSELLRPPIRPRIRGPCSLCPCRMKSTVVVGTAIFVGRSSRARSRTCWTSRRVEKDERLCRCRSAEMAPWGKGTVEDSLRTVRIGKVALSHGSRYLPLERPELVPAHFDAVYPPSYQDKAARVYFYRGCAGTVNTVTLP